MQSPCGPPEFDQQDWSQFDFSRWHLDGVALDAASAAVADLSERLFNSMEWREHFQTTLPALQRQVLGFYREHSRQLQEGKTAIAQDFDARVAAARRRSEEFGKTVDTAASPPVVQPTPETFHVAVKVGIEETRVGLPGITVRLMDPRDPKTVLVQNVTDLDGNAVLTVPRERAKELDKSDTTLEVVSAAGKALQTIPDAVCIRLKQVETKVVALHDAPDIEPHKTAALELRSEREVHARNLAARIDRLKQEQQARLRDLDCRLEDNQKIIVALEPASAPAAQPSGPTWEQAGRPYAEPSKEEQPPTPEERPSAPKKRRKKR
ncbi:MAG: hypothetical protein ACREOC_03480 [Gemmatimonadales bacterium]